MKNARYQPYRFPESLAPLRDWLKRRKVAVHDLKSERQALHFASKLSHEFVNWPPRGKPCFPELQRLQGVLCKKRPQKPAQGVEAASPVRTVPDSVWRATAARYGATMGEFS